MAHFEKGNKSIELIINCAIDEFSQNGNKTTLNSICEKYHISKGRMYHFFTSKEDLLCSCFKYSLDKISKTINDFEVNDNCTVEDNLHNYYNLIINHWLKHPNEIITISQITKKAQIHFTDEGRSRLMQYKKEWANCVTSKFLQIIKAKKLKMRVNEFIVNQVISTFYLQVFLRFSDDLIIALKQENYKLAKEKKTKLLKYYDILIDTFLNGIIDRQNLY